MNPSTTFSVAPLGNIGRWAVAPLQIRSFTSIQMVHTHIFIYIYTYPENRCLAVAKIVICHVPILLLVGA